MTEITPMASQQDSYAALTAQIKDWAKALGFTDTRISDTDLSAQEPKLMAWLAAGNHGEMHYMAAHGSPPGTMRARPTELVPGTLRIITVRMPYLEKSTQPDWQTQELVRVSKAENAQEAVISLYARGRDYHKVLRQRLQTLAEKIKVEVADLGYRVMTDSAPTLEVALANKAGLGWRGKHTLLVHPQAGSMFFLGEIFVNIPLPLDPPIRNHCGTCSACIQACPTGAITAPYHVDARRCISYLTIEYHGEIPENLRERMGNRIYGCDDCQLVCPWNKFAQKSVLSDFDERHQLGHSTLLSLFAWDETSFQKNMAGSPIYRIGFERWQRNLAVALGNALRQASLSTESKQAIFYALQQKIPQASPLVQTHIAWALKAKS